MGERERENRLLIGGLLSVAVAADSGSPSSRRLMPQHGQHWRTPTRVHVVAQTDVRLLLHHAVGPFDRSSHAYCLLLYVQELGKPDVRLRAIGG